MFAKLSANLRERRVNRHAAKFMSSICPESRIKARELGRRIKLRYPAYRDRTNREIAGAFIKAFPQFAYRIK
jgi:hypothetical protein